MWSKVSDSEKKKYQDMQEKAKVSSAGGGRPGLLHAHVTGLFKPHEWGAWLAPSLPAPLKH